MFVDVATVYGEISRAESVGASKTGTGNLKHKEML
jgi:hypothetical protein